MASLFMGVQLECSRCHDDPYRDWSQQDHWSLAAFFGRSQGDFNKIEVGKGPSKKPGEIVVPDNALYYAALGCVDRRGDRVVSYSPRAARANAFGER